MTKRSEDVTDPSTGKDDLESCFEEIFALHPQTSEKEVMNTSMIVEENTDQDKDMDIDADKTIVETEYYTTTDNKNIILHILSTKNVITHYLKVLGEKYIIGMRYLRKKLFQLTEAF